MIKSTRCKPNRLVYTMIRASRVVDTVLAARALLRNLTAQIRRAQVGSCFLRSERRTMKIRLASTKYCSSVRARMRTLAVARLSRILTQTTSVTSTIARVTTRKTKRMRMTRLPY